MKPNTDSRETLFLGWDRPLLPTVVQELFRRHATPKTVSLDGMVAVLPTHHAVSRLDHLLRAEGNRRGVRVALPRLVTVGRLAELLHAPDQRPADEFEQLLAWSTATRDFPADELRNLFPRLPERDAWSAWTEMAEGLRRLFIDLAAQGLSAEDVLQQAASDRDRVRWKILSRLQTRVLDVLRCAGLSDPDTESLRAAEEKKCGSAQPLLLIGTTDLNPMLVRMLSVAQASTIAFVAAPPGESSAFDEFGTVRSSAWKDRELTVQDAHVIGAADIVDQARAVAEALIKVREASEQEPVTVGVTDESQVAPLEIELRGCGLSTARQLGWTIAQTSVGRLFRLISTHLQRRTWDSFAALVRHAHVHDWITRSLEASVSDDDASGEPRSRRGASQQNATQTLRWLSQLDQLIANHYPVKIDEALAPQVERRYPLALLARTLVDDWLQAFLRRTSSPLPNWSLELAKCLRIVRNSAGTELSSLPDTLADTAEPDAGGLRRPTRRSGEAWDAALRWLEHVEGIPESLRISVDPLTAIEILSDRISEKRILDPASERDLPILGWLDLALDDAPNLVVCGWNHPFVPEAVSVHPFLPAELRRRLLRSESERRFARDAHATELLVRSRHHLRFIVGRRGADGSPTPPTRLMAAANPEDVAKRLRRLLGGSRTCEPVASRWDGGPTRTSLEIPKIAESRELPALSVTAFHDYLQCPYRFYLRHVLGIRPLDDTASELAANQFGDLIHGAVEGFGRSDDRWQADPAKIEARLIEHLHEYARERFGPATSTAVRLQIAQAEKRLRVVAKRQAERIAGGWVIHAVEAKVDEKDRDDFGKAKRRAGIEVDGLFMGLRGRFDRIDHHPDSNRWAILDYKTHGHPPEKKHLRRTLTGVEWIDLQLPLYRLMIPFLGIDADPEEVELGYFNVSDKESETRINVASFSPPDLLAAESLVHDCIRGIRERRFEPTERLVRYDDYWMILQTGVSARMIDAAESGTEGEFEG